MKKVSSYLFTATLIILAGVFTYCSKHTDKMSEETVGQTKTVDPKKVDLWCASISEEANLCIDESCIKYMEIWKDLFIQMNALPGNYYCRHIELATSGIGEWNDGISFGVCYSVKIDWATAFTCDSFIIYINNDLYPALDAPRNVYLEKTSIEKVVNMRAFSSGITKLTPDEKLKFNSLEDAMNFAIKQANVNTLSLSRIFIDRNSGHISLDAVESHDEINKCIFVTLDLINGQTKVVEGACYIF